MTTTICRHSFFIANLKKYEKNSSLFTNHSMMMKMTNNQEEFKRERDIKIERKFTNKNLGWVARIWSPSFHCYLLHTSFLYTIYISHSLSLVSLYLYVHIRACAIWYDTRDDMCAQFMCMWGDFYLCVCAYVCYVFRVLLYVHSGIIFVCTYVNLWFHKRKIKIQWRNLRAPRGIEKIISFPLKHFDAILN